MVFAEPRAVEASFMDGMVEAGLVLVAAGVLVLRPPKREFRSPMSPLLADTGAGVEGLGVYRGNVSCEDDGLTPGRGADGGGGGTALPLVAGFGAVGRGDVV